MRIPCIFRMLPAALQKVDPPASADELANADHVRKRYIIDQWPDPYMVDIVRAFRLVENAGVYIEVGTRDKGNVAWTASRLADKAVIIDIDIEPFPEQENILRAELDGAKEYHRIIGDSVADSTLSEVRTALAGRQADAIFCDSSHMYEHTLAEFDQYFPLLRPGGVLMYHDCYWEGNETDKGKAQALQQIDRFHPIYVAYMNEPVHRFLPRSTKGDVWGAVAIILND